MNSKEIRNKINSLLTEMQNIATSGFDAEKRAKFDAISKDVDTLENDAQRMEGIEKREADRRSYTPSPRPQIASSFVDNMSDSEKRDRFSKSFRSYALNGRAGMTPEETRDLLTTSDGTGGALIPQLFDGMLYEAQKWYGPVATLVRQRKTNNNGAQMKVSLSNDTANGITLLATEGTSAPAETDPAFASTLLGVDTVSLGLVKISRNELADSTFDLDAFIRESFGKRYARGLEKAITTGKDSAGTTLPNVQSLAGTAVVGQTTTTLANGIGWTDLTALYGALDPSYTIKPNWMFNSSTRSYLIGLKDGFGRPYFTPDPSQDNPFGKILGFDVVINQAMVNMGANAKPVLFGSLNDAYLLRTEGQPTILRLEERFADLLEVGFIGYSRIGGTSIVMSGAPNPLVSLQQAAS
jgi:HK97 family phage major capsid protein